MRFLIDSKVDMDVCCGAALSAQQTKEDLYAVWETERDAIGDEPLSLDDAALVAASITREAFADAAVRLGYERLPATTPPVLRRCECPEPNVQGHHPWCGWVRSEVRRDQGALALWRAIEDSPPD